MNVIELHDEINGVYCDVSMNGKVCAVLGDTGAGKSYLFQMLSGYLDGTGYSTRYISSSLLENIRVSAEYFFSKVDNRVDVTFLDDYDLYGTADLLQNVLKSSDMVVFSTHNLPQVEHDRLYVVEYESGGMTVRDV